jgi:hypothetical protein
MTVAALISKPTRLILGIPNNVARKKPTSQITKASDKLVVKSLKALVINLAAVELPASLFKYITDSSGHQGNKAKKDEPLCQQNLTVNFDLPYFFQRYYPKDIRVKSKGDRFSVIIFLESNENNSRYDQGFANCLKDILANNQFYTMVFPDKNMSMPNNNTVPFGTVYLKKVTDPDPNCSLVATLDESFRLI